MSLPLTIWSHVYLKSFEVIGSPSDHTADGAILYVTTCLPLTVVASGRLAIIGLGTSFHSPFCFAKSNTRGIVWYPIIQRPQADAAQLLTQSAQVASCSAPTVRVPAAGFAPPPPAVVLVLPPLSSSPPPHAAATSASPATSATALRTRFERITLVDLPGFPSTSAGSAGQPTRNPSRIVVKVKTTAVMTVILSRFRSTTVEPAIEPPSDPPPNMSESPPPRPACNRTRTMRISDTTMWKMRTTAFSTGCAPPLRRRER